MQRLRDLGLDVFFDIEGSIDAGESFPQRIADGVAEAKAVLAIWSPLALTRDWCRRECFLARQMGKLIPLAVAPLGPNNLREFVDVSFESIENFSNGDAHFGWSQTLAAIARALDRWVEQNPQHIDAASVMERANAVRRAGIASRPPAAAASTGGLTGAAAIWDRIRSSTDVEELQRFAESFVGTSEGLSARTRIAQLGELNRLRSELEYAVRYQSKWSDAAKGGIALSADFENDVRTAQSSAERSLQAMSAFEQKWPGSEWSDAFRAQAQEMRGIINRSTAQLTECENQRRANRVEAARHEAQLAEEQETRRQEYQKAQAWKWGLGCAFWAFLAWLILFDGLYQILRLFGA